MDSNTLIACVVIGVVLAAFLCYICVRTVRASGSGPRSRPAYVALDSPSVRMARNAFDRRVALAIHEAKQGAAECKACGFTNAIRAVCCVRCGSMLTQGENARKAKSGWRGRDAVPATSSPGRHQSDLHRRIRRRREWTRKVNSHGQLEWYHDDAVCDTALLGLPSYVLQTRIDSTIQSHETSDLLNDTSDSGAVEVVVITTPPEDIPIISVSSVTTDLQQRFFTTAVEISNANEADASNVAYANMIVTPDTRDGTISVDSATNAKLPLPTKLAQFITSMGGLVGTTADTSLPRLELERASLLPDSMTFLATIPSSLTRAAIRVDFEGEQGIDAGGVYREWFLLMNEAIVSPEAGIFTCVDHQNQNFYLNPHSREILGEDHLAHFLAAGRLLGRALLDGNVTGFHLAMPLLKIILGQPVGFSDLQYFDPEVYKHLTWLLENDGVDALCLDFTVTEKRPGGGSRTVELVPGGADIELTDANKVEFVDAKLKYLLFESVSEQLFAYLTGIYEVVPVNTLSIFDSEELDFMLCGSDEIDVDDWEANTLSSDNLMNQPSLEYFWKAVRELSTTERRQLLQFATGSTRVPPGGFCALASYDGKLCLFNLRGVVAKTTRGYLHSHACFNRLDVPLHGSMKRMREAVRAAISNESIGFTTA